MESKEKEMYLKRINLDKHRQSLKEEFNTDVKQVYAEYYKIKHNWFVYILCLIFHVWGSRCSYTAFPSIGVKRGDTDHWFFKKWKETGCRIGLVDNNDPRSEILLDYIWDVD